jgi:AraC family transcriptional regulator
MDTIERRIVFGRNSGLNRPDGLGNSKARPANEMNWESVYLISKTDGPYHSRFKLSKSVLIVLSTASTFRGTVRHEKCSQSFVSHPGSLFIFPARKEFDLELTSESSTVQLYLSAEIVRSVAEEVLPCDQAERDVSPRFAIFDPFLERACLSIRECMSDAAASHFPVAQIGRAIAGHLILKHSDTGVPDTVPALHANGSAIIARARQIIEARLDQHLTIADIAAGSGLSVYHFGRLFKEAAGMTLYQFVIRCRVDRAKALLASTDKPIVEVAHECGFADQVHLTRTFGQIAGTTPGAFRRNRFQ